MILGAEKSVETGRLVFLLRCRDCQQTFVRDALEEVRVDVDALPYYLRPWRCDSCEALHRSSMAGAFEEAGNCFASLARAAVAPVVGLLEKLRARRTR